MNGKVALCFILGAVGMFSGMERAYVVFVAI